MPSARVLSPYSSTAAPESASGISRMDASHARVAPAEAVPGPSLQKRRNILLVGFGVLLLLLVLCGLNALAVLSDLEGSNKTILQDFLQEQQKLDKVRSAIYLSGTYLRDYLLEPLPERAEQSRQALAAERVQVTSVLAASDLLSGSPAKNEMYNALRREIADYWLTIDPVLSWKPDQRHRQGYQFLRDEVFPRRSNTLNIADTITSVNQQQLLERDNRVLSLFSSFRGRLIVALVVLVIFGIVQAYASTAHLLRMEQRTISHLVEVTAARQELKDLSARLVTTQESERKNLSRELHDAVGQSLSAVQFELHDLAVVLGQGQDQLRNRVNRIRELVEASLAMIRNMARLLRPAVLDDLGLAAALEGQARDISRSTGVRISVQAEDLSEDLPDEHKICLFRIVQEALNNVCRHANADSVDITLATSDSTVAMAIQDDGRGFRPGQTKGLGLIGMQERVESLGGTLAIRSEPGKGTRIEAHLPFARRGPLSVPA
jgi:signal transduction histidine kinase